MRTRRKQLAFLAITLATPVLLLLAVEGALRLFWRGGALPLFVDAPVRGAYVVANPRVARRWFARETAPPSPIAEPFAATKPPNGFRVFVLGESSTAGFPYPRNATFSRMLRDVLRDALPNDSVEVINLGIAATNSYAMVDMAGEILDRSPDAVLIYSGHNEWYGALGAASTESWVSSPGLVRLTLRLQRWRIVMAVRALIARVGRIGASTGGDAASLMETLAGNREIPLGSSAYETGVRQFGENLGIVVRRLRHAGVPVFVASLASNLRDQPPFASAGNEKANAAWQLARVASADSSAMRIAFRNARDADVVRFRAPSAFDSVARAVAQAHGGVYVPVAEAFAAASPTGVPGRELFLEHVHPNATGYALIARTFFEAMRRAGVPRDLDTTRVRSWSVYESERWLTAFDLAIADHQRNTLLGRWPFVPVGEQRDYRATYRPRDLSDSLSFAVARGDAWERGKLQLATHFERAGKLDSAIAEYRGLARDAAPFETPHRLLGSALVRAGRLDEAEAPLRRALALEPTAAVAQMLARIVLRRRQVDEGIRLLEQSLALEPNRPDVLYDLALARGMAGNVPGARDAASRLARLAPNHPGLPGLLKALGGR